VVSFVTEGAFGRPALVATVEEGTVSWQLLGVVPTRKARRVKSKARRIPCFTIAPVPRRADVSYAAPFAEATWSPCVIRTF
jgi:hypothetical protein